MILMPKHLPTVVPGTLMLFLLMLVLPGGGSAQLNAPAYTMDQRLPNVIVEVVEYKPPYKLDPKKTLLPKLFSAPTVLVYIIPGQSVSEREAIATLAASKKWKKTKLMIAMRGLNPAEKQAGFKWIEENEISVPVVIDGSMELALGIRATRVPSYAMIDENAVLKMRQFSGLDKYTSSGATFEEVIAAIEAGKAIPVSDGQMREDTRILVGQKISEFTLEPAPYSAVKSPVKIGPGVREKPTLVVFWIATCPHCQREMPRVHQWWSKHKNDVELVTITRTESEHIRTHTTKYMASKKISDMPVYSGSGAAYSTFKVEGIPTWAMLHPDGTVVAAHIGEDSRLLASLDAALAKARR